MGPSSSSATGPVDGQHRSTGLWGRVEECGRITEAMERAQRDGCQRTWIVGPPGTGKTALCEWAVGTAEPFLTVVVSCVEGESELALGALLTVVLRLDAFIREVPQPYRRTLRRFVDGGGSGDLFALGAALLNLLAQAAEHGPVMIVVDDAHWIDPASGTILAFALRRLEADAVMVIIASRSGPTGLGLQHSVDVIELGGLASPAAEAMLRDGGPILSTVAAAVADATGGLPLALAEVATGLSGDQRLGLEPLPEPLPIGDRLLAIYELRFARLDADTRLAVGVVAAAGSAHLSISPALRLLDLTDDVFGSAERVDVLRLGPAGPVFPHPLMRTASLAVLTAPQRRRVHEALACVSEELEERALHLVRSCAGPSGSVADRLEVIARSVSARDGAVGAAGIWLDAGRLTPTGALRLTRVLRAGGELASVGRFAEAQQCFDEIQASCDDPVMRADAVTLSTWMHIYSPRAAAAARDASAEAERINEMLPLHAGRLRAIAATCFVAAGFVRDARRVPIPDHPGRTIALLPATPESTSPPHLLCLEGRMEEAEAWLPPDRVCAFVQIATLGESDPASTGALQLTVLSLIWLGRLDEAAELTTSLISSSRRDRRPQELPLLLAAHADIGLRTGRWQEAEALLDEAITLALDTGQPTMVGIASGFLARLAAGRGRDEYRDLVERELRRAALLRNRSVESYALNSLALGHFSTGRLEEAIRVYDQLDDLASDVGIRAPSVLTYRADQVEALLRAGDQGRATKMMQVFAGEVREGATPWGRGTLARLEASSSGDDRADRLFEISLLELRDQFFERARTQLCWGESLRRRRRIAESRVQLVAAIRIFDRLGATAWSERARRELRASGARIARPEPMALSPLTPQEMQVAITVARGHSNRDTASRLFVSTKTVEHHLSRVYQKLALRSRSDLVRLVATLTDADLQT